MTEQNPNQNEEQSEQLSMDDIWGFIGTGPDNLKTDEKPAKKEKPKKEKKTEAEPAADKAPAPAVSKKWRYPFQIYFAGRVHDTTGMFEDGTEYTGSEITSKMLEHHFYEFSGTVEYDYMEETNTLVAMFRQHKKG